ncbi:type I restriction enzyme endonuclease domain-containing protein [Acinetobacter junii]|uniref:DUF3387 domain-containing protein n=3 Tax=Acinetobacter junii TaxID=40215 RepID=A0AAW5RFW9_ACIJU|nr:type I restriction enzyme endonuclease domain-containing protein [Acinetobacter junii]EEY92823.1 hypothetical protein HMPREF0026_00099 [Acinetobacter junii SH205]MCU4397971.1 DUF3387 domain-containing protein [Acinetobacter junii]
MNKKNYDQILSELDELTALEYLVDDKITKRELFHDEYTFYRLLKSNPMLEQDIDERVLISMAVELTDKLKKSIIPDWQNNQTYKARIILMIQIILKNYHYPVSENNFIVEQIINLAGVFTNNWQSRLI